MEQRYQAVLAIRQDGWKIVEVARKLGVSCQSVHTWLVRYDQGGLAALADRSHRPASCAHQLGPELEALICEMRRQHPGWGPRRIEFELAKKAVAPMPSRSSIYRCLKRHSLIDLRRKRRRREEFRRWERERPMQLWQMDVMGGVLLDDGTELKVLTGIDDHSRFCIAAGLMRRATSRAVCEIFLASLRTHGVPDEIASLHPHKFPHTFATKYLFKGGNESVLMTEAGWSSNIASVAFLVSAIARIVEARNRAIGAYVQMSSLTKRKEFTETASSELCLTAYVEDWPLRPAQDPKHQARYPVTASPIIHDAKCHQVPFGGAPHEHAEQD